ncbi:GH15445 [Drosophila grimshawi]|uniref:GH15445 n=2 Tax=Drosophila grimshawi TaxID=7222 RepID=B4J2F0_DROGR|nr:GH15445 [Drosophila grimshawi]
MLRLTLLFTVLVTFLASVDSGNNTPQNVHVPHIVTVRNVPRSLNSSIGSSGSSSSTVIRRGNVPVAATAEQQKEAAATNGRDKRGTNNNNSANNHFQLDQSELARQNQITQQIFANFLERRLFPNRTVSQKAPTIADILPKPKPATGRRPHPRGFSASSDGFKRSGGGAQRNRLAAAAAKRTTATSSDRARVRYEDEQEDDDLTDQQLQANSNPQDEFDEDVQESLQSVESEQHDQYYGNIFHRDPSENEIDSDCPNCVDESQYTPNKWTMPLLKLGEKRYYLGIFFKANWFKATQYCRYHGMHLASISSQEENDRLEKHIRDFGLGHEHFWISGTDLADEGNYFWMATGRPITFTNWNAGEPNNFRYENGEEENCLELWNRDGKGLKWNDSPCSFETYFVCEVQPV